MYKERLKIIFSNFDDRANPNYGGGGAYSIHDVAKRLAKNCDVTVITGRYPGSKDLIDEDVAYKRIGFANINPQLAQAIYQFILPFYAISEKYDMWFESFTPPFSTAFLPLFTSRPVFGVTHLLAGKAMSEKYGLPFYLIESLGLKLYKNVIVLNQPIKEQILMANNKTKVSIIPNGISKDLMSIEFEKHGDYILFLGRIDYEQKGIDLLLNAYKQIVDKTKLNLVIAGGGSDSEVKRMKDTINKLNLNRRVEHIGKVEGEKKDELFRNAKIFVMASRYEAFPLTLLEAWAYKCPVIIFNIDVLKWIPENVANKVEPYDIKAFGDAMMNLLSNEREWSEKSENAKKFVRQFDWDLIAGSYIKLIEETIKQDDLTNRYA